MRSSQTEQDEIKERERGIKRKAIWMTFWGAGRPKSQSFKIKMYNNNTIPIGGSLLFV